MVSTASQLAAGGHNNVQRLVIN